MSLYLITPYLCFIRSAPHSNWKVQREATGLKLCGNGMAIPSNGDMLWLYDCSDRSKRYLTGGQYIKLPKKQKCMQLKQQIYTNNRTLPYIQNLSPLRWIANASLYWNFTLSYFHCGVKLHHLPFQLRFEGWRGGPALGLETPVRGSGLVRDRRHRVEPTPSQDF